MLLETKLAFLLLMGIVSAAAGGQEPGLPMRESFSGAELDVAWTVDVSKDNKVAVKQGALEIRAAENTYAHIERPLGVDCVRASCEIQPGSGISWATSLFLYWSPGNWCQMGAISRGDGRYYVCITIDGGRSEHDLGRCRLNDFNPVAIELGHFACGIRKASGSWESRPTAKGLMPSRVT